MRATDRLFSTENLTAPFRRAILGRFGEQSVCSRLPLVLRLGYTQSANNWVLRRIKEDESGLGAGPATTVDNASLTGMDLSELDLPRSAY